MDLATASASAIDRSHPSSPTDDAAALGALLRVGCATPGVNEQTQQGTRQDDVT
jgi:hypothetical protein